MYNKTINHWPNINKPYNANHEFLASSTKKYQNNIKFPVSNQQIKPISHSQDSWDYKQRHFLGSQSNQNHRFNEQTFNLSKEPYNKFEGAQRTQIQDNNFRRMEIMQNKNQNFFGNRKNNYLQENNNGFVEKIQQAVSIEKSQLSIWDLRKQIYSEKLAQLEHNKDIEMNGIDFNQDNKFQSWHFFLNNPLKFIIISIHHLKINHFS